jgi:hypothetical protein
VERFDAAYPYFDWLGHPGVRLWSTRGNAGTPPRARRTGLSTTEAPILKVRPRGSWSVGIFLQRYEGELRPGTHRFRYAIDIACWRSDPKTDCSAVGEGEFQVVVQRGGQEDLSRTIAGRAKGLEAPEYWTRRSALEALSLTTSPEVLQYVRGIMEAGDTGIAFPLLEGFRSNSRAASILVDAAQTGMRSEC